MPFFSSPWALDFLRHSLLQTCGKLQARAAFPDHCRFVAISSVDSDTLHSVKWQNCAL
jgi:hypothetical protein